MLWRMLLLVLLLWPACLVAGSEGSIGPNVECPELHPSTFCSDDDVPRGFEYSDGCSRHRCNFMTYSTLQSGDCPRAESLADQRRCRSVARAVFRRLAPRTCPNAAPATVCASVRGVGDGEGGGFRFTDGCNRFACAADGSVAGSTRRSCPIGDAGNAYCSFIVSVQIEAVMEIDELGSWESSESESSNVECPELHPSTFCSDDDIPRGFEYSDGCSRYRCNFMTYSTLQSGDCPRAESIADQRRCRSVALSVFSRLAPRTCPNAAPATVCASVRGVGGGDGGGFGFTDGCNRFACAADGSVAGSTWRSCPAGDARQAYCSFIVNAQIEAAGESANQSSAGDVSTTSNLECPELHPSTFCSDDDIPRGFEYSDGCSRYRCNFMTYSTLQSGDCPRAESLADQRRCRSVALSVFSRLAPRTCPNAAPATVCASVRGVGGGDGGGFGFTDGCNRFACGADGSVAGSTWRSCPAGDAGRAYCSFIEQDQPVDGMEDGPLFRKRRRTSNNIN